MTDLVKENIFKYIQELEGIRHPVTSTEHINYTAKYIKERFEEKGLEILPNSFKLKGSEEYFENIVGLIRGKNEKKLVIGAHYDSVYNSPGANDNLSGLSVLLEICNCLSLGETPEYSIIFVAFTLEEGNPILYSKRNELLKKHGLVGSQERYVSWQTYTSVRELEKVIEQLVFKGFNYEQAARCAVKFTKNLKESSSQQLEKYSNDLIDMYTQYSEPSEMSLIGSKIFMDSYITGNESDVVGMINLDTLGYTSKEFGSQVIPEAFLKADADLFNVSLEKKIGNFLTIISSRNATHLVSKLTNEFKCNEKPVPYYSMNIQEQDVKKIFRNYGELMSSDHVHFWLAGIPVLYLTDTGRYRYPYYHTPADASDYLDFDFMEEITKKCVKFIRNL
ncbi:Predicted aminopeptidases [Paenibacillus uliginis N3/975]|uniref:Predicted aminopeptidases n=1 Tax=Paenibacillus uliginis N3/975 TaxID=1313296 RepID=A0A1X7GZN0_9BACL|nr:M28 family peptidase [Paenibacillus uliginis]SMF77006.1 Predicted aminopeptidases [Paenibacillus uliginis N3/975]